MLKVMIVDEVMERAEALRRALIQSGYEVIALVPSASDLRRRASALKPDIIIIDIDSPDPDTIESVGVLGRDEPRPVVMFTHDGDTEKIRAAVQAGVSAYIVDGMSTGRIRPILDAAIARFEQFQLLKRELEATETRLAERKVIERAKGILMKSRNLSEDDAYRALRKQAMESNAQLAQIARQVIAVASLMTS